MTNQNNSTLLPSNVSLNLPLLLEIVKKQLSDDKIENIDVYDVQNALTHYIVIGSGTSSRHIHSSAEKLANKVEETLQTSLRISMEGNNRNAQWILIDLKDIIVHLFTAEARENYKLEELYK